jgi:hypothetical protein
MINRMVFMGAKLQNRARYGAVFACEVAYDITAID